MTVSDRLAEGLLERGDEPSPPRALFLSTRTVEAQLSGAYAKLAINSRAELGDALGATRGGKVAPR
jgi:hypothetical protein